MQATLDQSMSCVVFVHTVRNFIRPIRIFRIRWVPQQFTRLPYALSMKQLRLQTDDLLPRERRLGRLKLGIGARLALIDGEARCKILDLSLDGAKVSTDRDLYCGEAALLKIDELEAFGSIIWAHDGLIGIRFDERLTKEQLMRLRHGAIGNEKSAARQAAKQWASGSS